MNNKKPEKVGVRELNIRALMCTRGYLYRLWLRIYV